MSKAIVILVNGEVLAGSYESKIIDQKNSALLLAEGLKPIFSSELNVAIMHVINHKLVMFFLGLNWLVIFSIRSL